MWILSMLQLRNMLHWYPAMWMLLGLGILLYLDFRCMWWIKLILFFHLINAICRCILLVAPCHVSRTMFARSWKYRITRGSLLKIAPTAGAQVWKCAPAAGARFPEIVPPNGACGNRFLFIFQTAGLTHAGIRLCETVLKIWWLRKYASGKNDSILICRFLKGIEQTRGGSVPHLRKAKFIDVSFGDMQLWLKMRFSFQKMSVCEKSIAPSLNSMEKQSHSWCWICFIGDFHGPFWKASQKFLVSLF